MMVTDTPLIRIVDDDAHLRKALAFLLENEGYETATYSGAVEFLQNDAPSRPGCLILDVRMPGMNGLELQRELVARSITVPVIFLTAFAEVEIAVSTMKLGACDFLEKPIDEEKLLTAVADAVRRSRLAAGGMPDQAEAEAKLKSLTPRELEIVRMVSQGLLNSAIAERLGIALRTVKFHRASAYRKLGVHTSAELALCFSVLNDVHQED